ncbi:hypothetical protein C4D60_Mb05t15030 [Musa balbisiana]|uniref:Uncharacterized protein n=1 Tax=Musa balbisiana TaxID=52838 RepID=A0A4S8JW87_MUSBA|nr:hypothetical protein C4D60_Mb05t15030 [Musa balbisiana]
MSTLLPHLPKQRSVRMAFPSSATSPPSPFTLVRSGEKMLPPSPDSSFDEKAARRAQSLGVATRSRLHGERIIARQSPGALLHPEDYVLLAPEPGQRAYDPIPKGFALTLDALEAGLLSLCTPSSVPAFPSGAFPHRRWCRTPGTIWWHSWRSATMPTSPQHSPFSRLASAFPRGPGVTICQPDRGFGLRWSARMIDNTAPALNDDEYRDLRRLKEILPSSRAIRNMTERWLIKAGLSPTPRDMVNLRSVHEGRASSVSSLRPQAEPRISSKDAPVEVETGRPRKKTKTCVAKASDAAAAHLEGATTEPADHAGRSLERGEAGPSRERVGKAPREPSIRELCRLPTALFIRRGLYPDKAWELYTSSFEVLLGKSAKSLLWGQHYAMALMDCVRDTGRVIGHLGDRNVELRREIEEILTGAAPEAVAAAKQHASDLEVEATHLRSELKATEEQNKGLQELLRSTKFEVRLARGETLALNQKLEEVCAKVRAASEALVDEIHQRLEKDRKLIEAYKKSSSFELELTRTGQVTYEYGYRITLAHFRARYLDLEVPGDPFNSFPEDLGVDMPEEVPFDDNVEAPGK